MNRNKCWWYIAVFLLFSVSILYISRYILVNGMLPADDAYIHMRIAKNFVEYGKPYFNIDQNVSASSSVLWLITISILFKLFGYKVYIIVLFEIIITASVLLSCLFLFTMNKINIMYAAISSVIVVCVFLVNTAALLMETPLVVLMWVISLICMRNKKFALCGLFAGLSFATRYELLFWVVLCIILSEAGKRKIVAVCSLFIAGLVLCFNMYFFNSLLPNTINAKSIVYSMNFIESVNYLGFGRGITYFSLFLLVNLYLLYYSLRKMDCTMIAVVGFAILVSLAYVSKRVLIFPWYTPLYLFPTCLSYVWFFFESKEYCKNNISLYSICYYE